MKLWPHSLAGTDKIIGWILINSKVLKAKYDLIKRFLIIKTSDKTIFAE
jgi:hypothetical protein